MKETITPMDTLERAIMLHVNEQLFQKNYISRTQYEYAKVKIVNYDT